MSHPLRSPLLFGGFGTRGRDAWLRRRARRRRRPDERVGFVMLSGGADLASMLDTTTQDLCLILSLVGAVRLPATRAQEFTRASLARQPVAAILSCDRAANHDVRAVSSRCAPPIVGRARVASPACCPALHLSSEAPLPLAHWRPLCGASGAGSERAFSLG